MRIKLSDCNTPFFVAKEYDILYVQEIKKKYICTVIKQKDIKIIH